MKKWLRRIRGAVLMGLTWALVWAPVGILIGIVVDPTGSMDEPWILVGAYPGFLSGVLFSIVLGVAEGRRRIDDLTLSRVGALGAVAGLLLGLLPFYGLSDSASPLWAVGLITLGPMTLLGAASAAATLALARRGEKRELLGEADLAEVGLTDAEKKELLGGK